MLSHPLLVEAVDSEFVACAIYNNKKGKDASVLKRFKEPALNNPVVRYLDHKGKNVIPRKDSVWSLHAATSRTVEALEAGKRSVPAYLRLLVEESKGKKKKATFAMHCFWEGEALLGSLPKVGCPFRLIIRGSRWR